MCVALEGSKLRVYEDAHHVDYEVKQPAALPWGTRKESVAGYEMVASPSLHLDGSAARSRPWVPCASL